MGVGENGVVDAVIDEEFLDLPADSARTLKSRLAQKFYVRKSFAALTQLQNEACLLQYANCKLRTALYLWVQRNISTFAAYQHYSEQAGRFEQALLASVDTSAARYTTQYGFYYENLLLHDVPRMLEAQLAFSQKSVREIANMRLQLDYLRRTQKSLAFDLEKFREIYYNEEVVGQLRAHLRIIDCAMLQRACGWDQVASGDAISVDKLIYRLIRALCTFFNATLVDFTGLLEKAQEILDAAARHEDALLNLIVQNTLDGKALLGRAIALLYSAEGCEGTESAGGKSARRPKKNKANKADSSAASGVSYLSNTLSAFPASAASLYSRSSALEAEIARMRGQLRQGGSLANAGVEQKMNVM